MPEGSLKGALRSKGRTVAVAFALLFAIAMPIVQLRLIVWKVPCRNNDLIPISEGVRAVLQHEDPYSVAVTRRIQTAYWGHPLNASEKKDEQHFAYPVYAALVLAPFGVLPWEQGRLLFLLLVPVLMALSVPMWVEILGLRASAAKIAVWTVLALASWPMVWGLRLCQVTLPIAFLVAAGCLLLRRRHDTLAGLLFSLSIAKPQTTGPLLAYLFVWALMRRRWAFPVALIAACGALAAWAQWMAPGWVPHWIETMRAYSRYTEMGLIPQLLFGRWIGAAIVGALAVSGVALLCRIGGAGLAGTESGREFGFGIALVLALTLAIMPAAAGMNYNDVLLLPGVLLALCAPATSDGAGWVRRLILLLLWLSYAAISLAVVLELVRGTSQFLFALPAIPILALPAATAWWMIANGFKGFLRQRDGNHA